MCEKCSLYNLPDYIIRFFHCHSDTSKNRSPRGSKNLPFFSLYHPRMLLCRICRAGLPRRCPGWGARSAVSRRTFAAIWMVVLPINPLSVLCEEGDMFRQERGFKGNRRLLSLSGLQIYNLTAAMSRIKLHNAIFVSCNDTYHHCQSPPPPPAMPRRRRSSGIAPASAVRMATVELK